MSQLEAALQVMLDAHRGQTDKAGQPYVLHPLRLMARFQDEDQRLVALLHDVVEDGDVTPASLRALGFSEPVVVAVECLTRRSEETYEDFIARIRPNPLANSVKVEDIRDNLDVTRLRDLKDEDLERLRKYWKALQQLRSETTAVQRGAQNS